VGLVLHRALETWEGKDERTLRQAAARLAGEIAPEEAVDPTGLPAEVREILDAFTGSPLAIALSEVEILGREIPLLLHAAGGPAWRGSIDLLYRDAAGVLVIADYKTDRDTGDAALAARYGPQLAVYAEAVQRALGLDEKPRRELWLLRSGRRIDLPDEPAADGAADSSPHQLSLW
jgi:ATP-dependent exoDNAse (exonuclease V) beta subunit